MKIRITTFATELGVDPEVLFKLRDTRLDKSEWTGTGKNTYFTDNAQAILRMAIEVPLAVPENLMARVVQEARNPRWVFAQIIGRDGKVPVAIPRKLRGVLLGKEIPVHEIVDANGGVTFRHASLAS